MSDKLSAQTTVSFRQTQETLRLSLEYHVGPFQEGRGTPLRLYPDVPATLRATKGTVVAGETRVEECDEIISFSGSDTATLKRPMAYAITFESTNIAFDSEGNTVNPDLHYDGDNDKIISSIPFYGGFRVTYKANYTVLYYTPITTYTYYADGSIAWYRQFGTVYAFYNGASVSMDVETTVSSSNEYMEFYRVISKIVLDQDGAHEMPPNWEDNPPDGHYPNMSTDHDLDPDNSFTDERIHELGEANKFGSINTLRHRYSTSNLDPYTVGSVYTPKYKVKWGTVNSSGLSEDEVNTWNQAFARINKDQLLIDLGKRFPGITANG